MPESPRVDDVGDSSLEPIIEVIEDQLNKHGSVPAARSFCVKLKFPEHLVFLALEILNKKRKLFENLEPWPIEEKKETRWYFGPSKQSSRYWDDYLLRLQAKGWSDEMINALDLATSRAVDLLEFPGRREFRTRGLVIGRVQSGKTAHFTGVIAKAADCGYRLFIVLSGITNCLRLQTQKRLDADLGVVDGPKKWFWLTRKEVFGDFDNQPGGNVDVALQGGAHRAIAVIKKQTRVLDRLIDWFRNGNAGLLRECPVLVIDDEADQASINTSKSMESDELTRINNQIVDLLNVFTKCAYVGYTATPFANVLIHPDYPDNLYPRSFIFPLDPPRSYFGPERIHGRMRLTSDELDEQTDGLPLIRIVPDGELASLKPVGRNRGSFHFQVTDTLQAALRYFFMATAARLFRERAGMGDMDFSTMLIHTSHYVLVHQQTAPRVREAITLLRAQVVDGSLSRWESSWNNEMSIIDVRKLNSQLAKVDFQQLQGHLLTAIDRAKVVVSNSMRDEDTNITFETPGEVKIVVGGNTLSRGLTLEGLVVSFFVRSANAYDTILQMGRWFGYRPKYEDLPRIWMTEEMRDQFHDLATIEEEFREQLDEYHAKDLSPMEAAMRIRRLPNIKITAPNKMRFAVTCQIGYGGARPQTIYFRHKDSAWLQRNIDAACSLISKLGEPTLRDKGRVVWTGCPVSKIHAFLGDYQFHERSRGLDAALMRKYIEKQNKHAALTTWNVVVYGLDDKNPALGSIRLREDVEAFCINRSRMSLGLEDAANIKALMAPSDILADRRDFDPEALKTVRRNELFKRRSNDPSGVVILYPISKDSKPARRDAKVKIGEPTRLPLDAANHLIGVAMVFPDTIGQFEDADYVQADLKPIESIVSGESEDDDELGPVDG